MDDYSDDSDEEVPEINFVWYTNKCGTGMANYMGSHLKSKMAEIKLSGQTIIHIVDNTEFTNRCLHPSTKGMHNRKRLRSLKHWSIPS